MLTSISPSSPANNNSPAVIGTAEANSTIKLYSDAACNTQVASGTADELEAPGITITVTDDTTSSFYATAADPAGNVSPCSAPITYVEDSTAPAAPTLADTLPLSPSRSLSPKVRGTAEEKAQVAVYASADCTGTPLGMGLADANGNFAVDIAVSAASTTELAARARDAAGNLSACSGFGLTYIHNANALSAPTLTASTPTSPSKTSTTPMLAGMAEANVTVRIYSDALCSSAQAGSGTSNAAGMFAIGVTVGANTTTSFYAQAFDPAVGQLSACSSSGLTYVHDTIVPAPPSVTGSTPASPSNSMTPTITGTAEAGSTVALFTNASCTTAVVGGTGTATAGGTFSIMVSLSGSTTYYARATDAAGNSSACSASGYSFVYDATAPNPPSLTGTSPTSPSASSTTPIVVGAAENGSTVHVYRTSNCTGPEAGSGLATPGFGVSITVPSNSSTPLSATAADVAGNVSACSSSVTYVHDSISPPSPALTSTLPTSPANNNMPVIAGTAEPMASVQLYTDAACTSPIGAPTVANGTGNFTVSIAVTDNTSTTVYARATDPSGNASACSSGLGFVEDSNAPGQPTLNSLPPSSSNTMPTLTGTAEPSSTVYIYASGSCGGSAVAMGAANGSGAYSIGVTVSANTSTQFTAKAVDAAGNGSPCSTAMSYVHDNMAPARPTALASSPPSPAASTAPSITGTAEAGSTVRLYTSSTCMASVAGTGTATGAGSFSIPVTVSAGSTTTFYATATDSANNTSLCSTAFVTYLHDAAPPSPPSSLATVPGSPANNTMPSVTGNAEASSTVKLYTAAGCGAGSFAAQGTTSGGGTFSIPVTVPANTTTTFYATATDAAGNASTCTTTGVAYVHDSTPPATPTSLRTTPPSPANHNNPHIQGTTEAAAAVAAYLDPSCGMLAGSTTAAGSGSFDIAVTVADNTTTTFYLRATDAAGNTSPCTASASITYVEDSTAVAPPVLTSTTPTSPSNSSTTPTVIGTSGASFQITLYTDAQCAGAPAGTGTANGSGAFSIAASVNANTTTTFYATASNGVNTSACSSGLAYVHDNIAPVAPSGLAMQPQGPANNNTPSVLGTAEAGTTVRIYTNATCTSAVVGTTTSTGSFAVTVTAGVVTDNSTTTFYARATDAANNVSPCSAGVAYVEDSAGPSTPTIASTTPASPANANNPMVNGSAEAGAFVTIYGVAGCGSTPLGSGTANGAGAFSIQISVGDNSTTPLYAKAVDAASNPSACSTVAFSYTEDSAAPDAPTLTMVSPAGPANNNSPVITGSTSEPNATIRLYDNGSCSGVSLGIAISGTGGAFVAAATVADDTSTVFYANATDAAGNTSGCSKSSLSYVEDSQAPDAPKGLAVKPSGPANDNQPIVYGGAEAGATVLLYTDKFCSSAIAGSGTVDASGEFAITVLAGKVLDDSQTSFFATATDSAGNVSTCSDGVDYIEDSTALPPVLVSTTPTSPSRTSTTPTINGTAEAFATVTLYANSTCTGAPVGSGTSTSAGSFAISVTSVLPNTSTTYRGTITDQAGNTSACSTTSVTFISDQNGPTFAGASSAVASGTDQILVTWTTATDNFTSAANMRYEICWGLSPRACDTWTTRVTATGTTSRLVTGLNPGLRYYFQVRALDQANNTGGPNPQVEVSERTFSTGSNTTVATGYGFACAVSGDGTVKCWGAGTQGQLGNNTTGDSLVPVTVQGLVDVVSVSAGGSQSIGSATACAVKSDGTVWCWGYGGNGNLGNGGSSGSSVPVQVLTAAATQLTNAVSVAVGGGHACAVISDGTMRCWGRNSDGQLGDNTTTQRNFATLVNGGITTFTAVDAGAYHTCAVLADGTARCWGQNTWGQLGNSSNVGSAVPVTVSLTAPDRAKAIDVGDFHSCALVQNGTVRCWGANTTGQLGNNTTTNSNTPVSVLTLTNAKAIAAGGAFVGGNVQGTSCATLGTGQVRCWGYNGFGQLGIGNTMDQLIPVTVSSATNSVRSSVGNDFACRLLAGGTVQCWGNGANGRIGNNSTTGSSTSVAVQNLAGPEGVTVISAGSGTECARFTSGRVRCWGYNGYGQVGNGTTTNAPYPETPISSSGGGVQTTLTSVSAHWFHGCALRGDGAAVCWGNNEYGQLGDGTTTGSTFAVNVSGLADAVAIATGFYHSCALISDGTIKCWGFNAYGQLGNNSTINASSPVTVMGISTAVEVIGLGNSTCARLVDGSARCWGYNAYGQLGDSSNLEKYTPVAVTGLVNATGLAGGAYHTCATIAGGTAKCWGQGDKGQVGNGMVNVSNTSPVSVTGSGFLRIAAGFNNTCSTKGDGRVYCWGANANGQVGDGTTNTPVTTPKLASGVATVVQVTTGPHSSGLLSDGTVDAWGEGTFGQCGDGKVAPHDNLTPGPVLYLP